MLAISIVLWFGSLTICVAFLRHLLSRRALAGCAAIGMFCIVFHARPLIFFLGLDQPFPEHQFYEYWHLVAQVQALGIVWSLLFVSTYVLLRPAASGLAKAFPTTDYLLSTQHIVWICILATGVSTFANFYLIASEGSISSFVYAVKIEKDLAGLYVVRQLSVLAAILCLVGLMHSANLHASAQGVVRRRIPLVALAIFSTLILVNLATNFMWGNRFNIAMFLVTCGLAYHVYVRRISAIEIVAILMVLAIVLQSLRVLRELILESGIGRHGEINFQQMSIVRHASLSLHLSEFDACMLAIRDAGSVFPFRLGQDFWNGLVSWIPRQLWEGKPETFHVGHWFRQVYEPERVNGWPVTVVGSWYVNFGIFGVALGAWISGIVVAAVDRCYRSVQSNPLHAVLAPAFGLFLFDGGVNTGFVQNVFLYVLPMAVFCWFMRWIARRESTRLVKRRRHELPFKLSN